MRKLILQSGLTFNYLIVLILLMIIQSKGLYAQTSDTTLSPSQLKKLSLEQLMDIEVTSVSKRPEKLSEAASAIQVITQEDIRHSGAKTLPEALKLAANLQVAQANNDQWGISARGFDNNNMLANKLLVLVDGRVVYTPLYAGVYWDMQNVMLEDVDRIEVISGPGGTIWGDNAVNGVINIITKSSKDTQGFFAEAASGQGLPGEGSIRFGGKVKDGFTYRAYATGFKMGSSDTVGGRSLNNAWPMAQGGIRADWDATKKDNLSLQGNIYYGKPSNNKVDSASIARGNNVMLQWNHKLSDKADFQLMAYYDETYTDLGMSIIDNLKTYNLDWLNKYKIGHHNIFTYGLTARVMDDNTHNYITSIISEGFFPSYRTLFLYGGFAQDEILLLKNKIHFTIGSKVDDNNYTGVEYQPNARLAWLPGHKNTIWAAVSRAVRTPSRIDRDFATFVVTSPFIEGSENFISETLIAYELGWRCEPVKNLSFSVSTFYNMYNDIRSAEPGLPPSGFPVTFGNDVQGYTYGAELAFNYQLTKWWKVRGGYTFLKKMLSVKPGTFDLNNASAESDDPENQFLIQSYADLPGNLEAGIVVRYVDALPNPHVPGYVELDGQIGWKICKALEVSVVGQNLLDKDRLEFIQPAPAPVQEITRCIYGKITCHF